MKSLVEYKIWEEVKPYAYLEYYHDQPLKSGTARKRRKVTRKIPPALEARMKKLKIECASCGKLHKPFRFEERGGIGISVVCPLKKNIACARKGGKQKYSTVECLKIEASLGGRSVPLDPRQEALF